MTQKKKVGFNELNNESLGGVSGGRGRVFFDPGYNNGLLRDERKPTKAASYTVTLDDGSKHVLYSEAETKTFCQNNNIDFDKEFWRSPIVLVGGNLGN